MLSRSHALEFGGSTAERDEVLDVLRREGIQLVRRSRPRPVDLRDPGDACRYDESFADGGHRSCTFTRTTILGCWRSPADIERSSPSMIRSSIWVPAPSPAPRRGSSDRWFRRAERFVVHGQALAEELAPIVDRSRIIVIPHGVSPRSDPLPRPESPSVLLFGRLEQYKGVEVLVEAMRLVWERRPETRLVVAGEGQAARLVPEDPRISLISRYVPEREVETLFADASLVVLPYTQASQSGVGVMAIARGVPVVVSDLGALPELACDPSFIFEAGNPRALAETIVRHLDDGAEVRSGVLRHAQSRFSWDRAAQLSAELYRELTTQNGPTSPAPQPLVRARETP